VQIFEDEVSGAVDGFHFLDHAVGSEGVERFGFRDAHIDEVFFKGEILSGYFEITDIVAFRCIDIENPYIIDSESADHKKCKDISLGEAETVVLPRSFSLGEERECTSFHYQYVCIHELEEVKL